MARRRITAEELNSAQRNAEYWEQQYEALASLVREYLRTHREIDRLSERLKETSKEPTYE